MKKLLICLLLVTNFFYLQSGDQKQDDSKLNDTLVIVKSKLTDHALLFGSAAIIAGGCFVGKKHLAGFAWVGKKYFDQKMREIIVGMHGIRVDIMQAKSHLHSKIDRLEQIIKNEFNHTNSKLDLNKQKLDQLQESSNNAASDLKKLHEKIDELGQYLRSRP